MFHIGLNSILNSKLFLDPTSGRGANTTFVPFILVVSDLPSSTPLEWKAHRGKVYEVQFGSFDEEKVYSLGEDKMFYLWATSTTSAPLRKIHFDNYQHPPQQTWEQSLLPTSVHVTHPAAGKTKLFGFCFGYKYILISSVDGKVVYKVKKCNLGSNISQFVCGFRQF